MPALRISCLGILLKHHLLRHHGDEIAPRGRVRPDIAAVLIAFPADFQLEGAGELPSRIDSCGEERLTLRIDLGSMVLALHGLLAKRGVDEPPSLLPYSIRLDSRDHLVTSSSDMIRDALVTLSGGSMRFMLESESRIGVFQPVERSSRARRTPPTGLLRDGRLARVA